MNRSTSLTILTAMAALALACDGTTTSTGTGGTGTGGSGIGGSGTGGAGGTASSGSGGSGGSGAAGACPATAPAEGSSCDLPDQRCGYGDSLRPRCRDLLDCDGGQWTIVDMPPCVPPHPSCPAQIPPAGTECTADLVGTHCEFTGEATFCQCTDMICGGPCQLIDPPEYFCNGPPAAAGCPDVAPNIGTPCDTPGAECPYLGGACFTEGVLAVCENGVWFWDDEVVCPL